MRPILKIIIVFALLIILKKLLKKLRKYFEIMDVYQGVKEMITGKSGPDISLTKNECYFHAKKNDKIMIVNDNANDPYGCFIYKNNGNIIFNSMGTKDCSNDKVCIIKDKNEILLDTYQLIANLNKDDTIKVYHKGTYKGSFQIQNKVDSSTDQIKNVTWKNKIANVPVFGFGTKNVKNEDDPPRIMFSGTGMIGNISIMGAFDDKWYDANAKKVEFKIDPKPIRMPSSNSPYLYNLNNSKDLFHLEENDTVNVYQKGEYLDFFIVGKHNTFPGSTAIEIFGKHIDPNKNNIYKPISYGVMSPDMYTFNGKSLYELLENKGTLSATDWNYPLQEFNISFKKIGYLNPFLTTLEDFRKIQVDDIVHIFEKNIEIASFVVKEIEQGSNGLDKFKIKSEIGGNTVIGWGEKVWDPINNKNKSGLYFNKYIIETDNQLTNDNIGGTSNPIGGTNNPTQSATINANDCTKRFATQDEALDACMASSECNNVVKDNGLPGGLCDGHMYKLDYDASLEVVYSAPSDPNSTLQPNNPIPVSTIIQKFGNVQLNGKQSWKIDSIENQKWNWGATGMDSETDYYIRIKYTPKSGFPTPGPTTSPPPTSPPPTYPPATTPPPIDITSIKNVFIRNILSPITATNPDINSPYSQEEMNLFNNNGLDYTKFGTKNKQWFYNNIGMCVGLGEPDDFCDASKYFCVGGSKFGSFVDQRKTVLEHIDYYLKNEEFHPNCPLNLQIDRTFSVAAITISPISFSIKENEEGSFGVVLEKRPISDVYVDIKADLNEFSFSESKLTFTDTNWFSPQRVVVTAIDEFDINETRTFNITLEMSSNDLDYNALSNKNIIINKLNNDFAKYFLSPTNITLNEDEEIDVNLVLNSKPTHEVIFDIENTAFTQVSVNPSKIIFTPFNWNNERAIKIKGLEDSIIDGDSNSELRFTITSTDNNYSKLPGEVIKIKIIDSKKYEDLAVNYKCSCICENDDPTKCNCSKCFKIDYNTTLNKQNELGSNEIQEILSNYANTYSNIEKTGSDKEIFYFLCQRHRIILKSGILKKNLFNKNKKYFKYIFKNISSLMFGNKNFKIDFANYNRMILEESDINHIKNNYNIHRFNKVYYKFNNIIFNKTKIKNTVKNDYLDIDMYYLIDFKRWLIVIKITTI
jgi:hypothetical protein